MSFIRWILALPIIVGAILFALAHPNHVSVTWSPFEPPIDLPLYFVALMFLGGGFLLGTFVTWLGMGSVRQDRRRQKKEIKNLEKDIDEANKKIIEILAEKKNLKQKNETLKPLTNNNIKDLDIND